MSETFKQPAKARRQEYADLRRLKAELLPLLFQIPGVNGVGIGAGCVRVYTVDEEAAEKARALVEGKPVEVEVAGEIRAALAGEGR